MAQGKSLRSNRISASRDNNGRMTLTGHVTHGPVGMEDRTVIMDTTEDDLTTVLTTFDGWLLTAQEIRDIYEDPDDKRVLQTYIKRPHGVYRPLGSTFSYGWVDHIMDQDGSWIYQQALEGAGQQLMFVRVRPEDR